VGNESSLNDGLRSRVEASCHELTRLSGLIRQHSRKRKFEQNPEESGPEWKRKSSKDEEDFREGERKSPNDEEDDFREGDPVSPLEKTAPINASSSLWRAVQEVSSLVEEFLLATSPPPTLTAATATTNIATTTSATLCSEERTTNNSSSYSACAAEESDSDRDTVSSERRANNRESSKGNFASQTVRLLSEERGVQVETEKGEEGVTKEEERKAGERSELAKLRVSLIEAKVAVEKGELAVEALSQKVALSETTLGKALEEVADLKEEITNLKKEINHLMEQLELKKESTKSPTGEGSKAALAANVDKPASNSKEKAAPKLFQLSEALKDWEDRLRAAIKEGQEESRLREKALVRRVGRRATVVGRAPPTRC